MQGIHSFSFLAEHFFERFSPKSLHVSILLSTFALARILMRSTPHSVEMQIKIYGGSPSTCFYCPLWRKSIRVLADEEVRAAFFVPYRQPYPTDSGKKARTLIICKQLHQFSAQLSCARCQQSTSRQPSRLMSTERASHSHVSADSTSHVVRSSASISLSSLCYSELLLPKHR